MRQLFKPVDIASLVFFRIVFGVLGFSDVLSSFFNYHLWQQAYDPRWFQFRYYGFEWLPSLPEPVMTLLFIVACLLALAVAAGWRYRFTAPAFAFVFTYIFLLEKSHYLNHGYLFCWIAWVMALSPAWRALSLDVRRRPAERSDTAPYWNLFLLQFLMGVVYFYGGLAKLNADWLLRAMPLQRWLGARSDLPVIGPVLDLEATAYFMAWGGALLDLSIVFLMSFRRTRWFGFGLAVFFHAVNHLIFSIGIFPYLSLALTALYFPPHWPRRLLDILSVEFPRLARWRAARQERLAETPARPTRFWQRHPALAGSITIGIALLALVHLTVPLRHHFFPGNVAWTEEGHRYSWRMMLRTKRGRGHFRVVNRASGYETIIDPSEYLTDRQARKLLTHPDMILQFAHFLQDEYAGRGQQVAVYAHIRVKLNDGRYTPFIDENVDLTQVKWSFFRPAEWIEPPE